MKARVEGGWVRIEADVQGLTSVTVSFDGGPWLPCYIDAGDAIIRTSKVEAGRRSWRLRAGQSEVGSGVVEVGL